MNLWLFMFTDQKAPVASARIAANTKQEAAGLATERVLGGEPAKGRVVISHMGHIEAERPGVTQITMRQL